MNIFISWSKERSKQVAEILRDWLPNVIQGLNPWFSDYDIDRGTRWFNATSEQLEKSNFGIICLTPENLTEPWILFETGALSKTIEKSYVCPVLLDLKKTDLNEPLSSFQATLLPNKEEIFRLLTTINKALKESKLKDSQLEKTFKVWWPGLNAKLKKLPKTDGKKFERPSREILEEILTKVRHMKMEPLLKVMESLSPREEKAIRMKYGIEERSDYTIEEISRVLGVPPTQIEKILDRAIRRLGEPERIRWLLFEAGNTLP